MPEYRPVWIANFLNIDSVRQKLGSKYGIDVDLLEEYSKFNSHLRGYDEWHSRHGLRTVIQIPMPNGKYIRAVIELVDNENDSWIIRTARYLK